MATETDLPIHLPGGERLDIFGQTETDLPLEMADGERLDIFGRMPHGMDESEFDFLSPRWIDVTPDQIAAQPDIFAGEKPAPFSPKAESQFPMLAAATKKFSEEQGAPKVVRIETDESHNEFVCEAAVRELSRRVDELRSALDEHLQAHSEEKHPGYHKSARKLRRWEDILGAAASIQKIASAETSSSAARELPPVPVNLPAYAEGKVKCWRDGDAIVCSMRFQAADGTARVATMATKPTASAEEILGWVSRSGANPVHVIGVLPEIAEAKSADRLVKDVASAALSAQRRLDVLGLSYGGEEALILAVDDTEVDPALAAMMHVEQQAQAGNKQAAREVAKLDKAAETPAGRAIVAPLQAEARARLGERRARENTTSFMDHYTQMALCLG